MSSSRVVQKTLVGTPSSSPWLEVVEPGAPVRGGLPGPAGGPRAAGLPRGPGEPQEPHQYNIYVCGQAVHTTQRLPVYNKYDGSLFAETSEASEELVRQALEGAYAAQSVVGKTSLHQRVAVLEHLARRLTERKEEIARIVATEAGKPLKDARVEVDRGVEVCRIGVAELYSNCSEYRRMDYTPRGENTEMLIRRHPVGVVGMIAPWNFPVNLVLHKIVPAIVAGCAWVLKPSSQTPVSALVLGEILTESGLGTEGEGGLVKGSWSIIPASREAADAIVTSDHIRVLSFTGSPAVGWELKKRVAAGTKILLELGGNAG